MAGPCSVENRDQIIEIAKAIKAAGAKCCVVAPSNRAPARMISKGLGEKGWNILADAREHHRSADDHRSDDAWKPVPMVAEYADILQIGARNMQNFGLLHAVGKTNRPVMLKRGISGMIKELLMCAEYIVSNGNYNVMLCERGIRTYETATRNTFDLNAVPVLKQTSHLPVVADPSHGTGCREWCRPWPKHRSPPAPMR